MARAVIHNSDASKKEAKVAIDQHLNERNEHFRLHPNRIWGGERAACVAREAPIRLVVIPCYSYGQQEIGI
jgi:hypothetical protein